MITQTASYYEIVSKLPADAVVTVHGVGWDEYEALLNQVGEASGLRISFNGETLQVMTLSFEHESYARFIERMISALSLRLRINIRFFGGATMKKSQRRQGLEPDACFYVQSVALIGNKMELDFEVDPPPDIAVEIDIHHDSRSKLAIYAALGVPEIWRYDGHELTIHLLQEDQYIAADTSQALPMLSGHILTDFLARLREDGEFPTILAFDEWLQSRPT